MIPQHNSYTPSGKFATKCFANVIIFNLLVTPLLSYLLILSTRIRSTPVILVIFILFAFLFGALVNIFCIERGKVRNVLLAAAIGTVCTLSCVAFQFLFSRHFGYNVHRMALLIETIYLTAMLVFFTMLQAKRPFSELSQNWYSETTLSSLSLIVNENNFPSEVASPDYEPYEHFRKVSDKEEHCSISIFHLPGEVNYISVTTYRFPAVRNYKSLSKFESKQLLKYYPINEAVGKRFIIM